VGKIFLAGIGGFVGSILRYSVSGFVQDVSRSIHFPYGTLAVNLIGCFAIGFLSQLAETRGLFTAETRTLVFVGVLGGFTTFSAFGNKQQNLAGGQAVWR
jgi:CrcB protein